MNRMALRNCGAILTSGRCDVAMRYVFRHDPVGAGSSARGRESELVVLEDPPSADVLVQPHADVAVRKCQQPTNNYFRSPRMLGLLKPLPLSHPGSP